MTFNIKPQNILNDNEINTGLRYLLLDGIFSQSMGSLATGAFLIAFALSLGATNFLIGIIAAIPFLANLSQIFVTGLIEKLRMRKIISVCASTISRIALLFLALTPFIFGDSKLIALTIFVIMFSLFGAISNAAFNSWMRDFVPQDIRGRYFAKRTRFSLLIGTVLSIFAAGYVDNFIKLSFLSVDPKYSLLFAIAFILGLLGIVFLAQIPEPQIYSNGHFSIGDLKLPFKDKRFRKLLTFIFIWSFSYSMVFPFFIVYMLTRLGLSILFVIGITAFSQLITVSLLPIWGQLIDKYGIKPVMRTSALFFLSGLLLWPYTTLPERYILTIPFLFVIYLLLGFASGGISLSSTIFSYKLSPENKSVSYITSYGTVASLSAGVAPIVGGLLTEIFMKMHLSLDFNWEDALNPITIILTDFKGLDFLFAAGFFIGLYSLYILKDVSENGSAPYSVVRAEFFYSIKRYIRAQFPLTSNIRLRASPSKNTKIKEEKRRLILQVV